MTGTELSEDEVENNLEVARAKFKRITPLWLETTERGVYAASGHARSSEIGANQTSTFVGQALKRSR